MYNADHGNSRRGFAGRAMLLVLAAFALAACTTPRQMEQAVDERADWRARAEAPVERFSFNFLRDWHPLEKDWLLLNFGGERDLAVQIRQPCVANVREATSVALVQSLPNQLHRQADRIRIDGRTCHIEKMRPVNPAGPDDEVSAGMRADPI